MKNIFFLILINSVSTSFIYAQSKTNDKQTHAIYSLIDQYSLAREKRDTVLLKSILTTDIDQLVSSGEWRSGLKESTVGMMRSSANSTGTRILKVEKIRFLNSECAIVDARYEIQNANGSIRKMWSTFIVVDDKRAWKISAIRNMLPAPQ